MQFPSVKKHEDLDVNTLSQVISDFLFQRNAFLASFSNRQKKKNLQESRLFLAPYNSLYWELTPPNLNVIF